ncbi:MAG TPA: hypothetical protein VFO10_06925 [Oligoflexus sp.]|uniref:hypothetical protein n=1 Tax=Oligoflexus sp. TaxID=1971216 RepID=UPI002D8061FA|nr:hypothetical protein [Oligoflexus sp.]HET9236965.1 hypothetical protein [Oligoflexus sp.]
MVISRKSLTIFGLALSAALFANGCSTKKPNKGPVVSTGTEDGVGEPGTPGDEPGTDGTTSKKPSKVEELASAYGILNFRQVAATLNALTGVQLNAPAAAGGIAPQAEYTRALSALPTDHSAAAISAGKVASLTKLASTYCDVLANNAQLLGAKFPGLTLAAVPADSAAFAKTLVDGFYGPETALQGPRAADIATVAATVDALKGITGATGPGIFMATCAGIVASGEFFVY